MTNNKQIIIDGVDVSECIFYQANFEEDFDVKIKHFCSNCHNSCESANNNNCYFKQLERKKQDEQSLLNVIASLQHQKNKFEAYYNGLGQDFDELKIENEKLQQECEELKFQLTSLGYADTICALEIDLQHKTQECEKLKLDLIEAKAHGDYLNNLALSETLNLVSKQLNQLKAENKRLKKKLKQIEKYCEEQNLKADYTACEILEIIDEENNENNS